MSKGLLFFLKFYKLFLSPFLGNRCRFYPSCSDYAKGCLEQHSLTKSSFLITKRLCKCHPFHSGGFDPVPL
ncbi:MAG: membrane protein insertion efficiency factor YidD [Bacteriovoracaceae bacterium]